MTRAVISLEFSTSDNYISHFPQVKTVSPRENIGPSTLLANDTDAVKLTLGDRTISFDTKARRHKSEDRVHNVTVQGSSRPDRNDPQIKNRAVWIIEEDSDLKAGIPHLFHGSLVVSCNSPFEMHLEVTVTQGIGEAIEDVVRKTFQEADGPVLFDPSTPLDPLGLASEDLGQNLDNLERLPLKRFVHLSDPVTIEQ